MNEIYKLLQNIHEIVKANNMFLQNFEQRFMAVEKSLAETRAMLEITPEAEPDIEKNAVPKATGAAKDKE